jgi:hypothetical protein
VVEHDAGAYGAADGTSTCAVRSRTWLRSRSETVDALSLMRAGATRLLVEATSDALASPRICRAIFTWQAAEDPWAAVELGHRLPGKVPPVESTTSMVNDSPFKARPARTYAGSRDAGSGRVD